MPKYQALAANIDERDALPLSTRGQADTDFDNLRRWIDGRLKGDRGGILEWHVLIADDDASNRLVLSSLLEKSGVTVTTAQNGREAVDSLKAARFDLALLDINMPVMDGLQAARAIRALRGGKADLPVIAITSDVSPARLAAMHEAGFDMCLEKPVRRDTMFRVVLGALSRRLEA